MSGNLGFTTFVLSDATAANWETNEKYVWGSPGVTHPAFSILDPVNTMSVPRDQTIYGMVDMMSHVFEQYFHNVANTPLQDNLCYSVLQTVIETAPKLLDDLESYENRETILYSGTIALNGTLQMGYFGDWASHTIEHAVSAVYDIPHAGGLAILFPNWMRHVIDHDPVRMKRLMLSMFDIETEGRSDKDIALEGVEKLSAFWTSLGAPSRLADYRADHEWIDRRVRPPHQSNLRIIETSIASLGYPMEQVHTHTIRYYGNSSAPTGEFRMDLGDFHHDFFTWQGTGYEDDLPFKEADPFPVDPDSFYGQRKLLFQLDAYLV